MAKNGNGHPFVRWSYIIAIALLTIAALYALWLLIIPIVFGFLFAYILSPVVDKAERHGCSRALCSGIILVVLISAFGITLRLAYPPLHRQVMELQSKSHEYQDMIAQKWDDMQVGLKKRLPPRLVDDFSNMISTKVSESLQSSNSVIPKLLAEFLPTFILLLFAPVLTFFS